MKVSVVNPTPITPTVYNAKKVANLRQTEGESKPNESTNLAFRNKAGWLGVIDSAIGGITDEAVKPTPQKDGDDDSLYDGSNHFNYYS